MAEDGLPVEVSPWGRAPFALDGETVFAVGDVHGCAAELRALLAAIADAAAACGGRRRLVFLGDLIDRGPDTLDVLAQWAEPASARGVDRVDRLMGNHEQVMLLAHGDGPHAAKARAVWLTEFRNAPGSPCRSNRTARNSRSRITTCSTSRTSTSWAASAAKNDAVTPGRSRPEMVASTVVGCMGRRSRPAAAAAGHGQLGSVSRSPDRGPSDAAAPASTRERPCQPACASCSRRSSRCG